MQPCCLCAQSWAVCGLCGAPVPQRGLSSLPVGQPVCDGEPGVSLQLRQNHEHLPGRGKTYTITSPPKKTSPPTLVDLSAQAEKLTILRSSVDLCRGGMLSMALRLPRVDTTLKLSLQSHDTCR